MSATIRRHLLGTYPVIVAAALLCSGCVPFQAYDSPAVKGEVVDEATHAPIPNAQVSVEPLDHPALISKVLSDALGQFQVPEISHRIWLPPLPFDPVYPDARITVSATGYQDTQQNLYELLKLNNYPNKVTIHLKRQ